MNHYKPKLTEAEAISAVSSHLRIPAGSGEYRMRCPIHHGEDDKNFSFNRTTGLAKCWTKCDSGWNAFELIDELGMQRDHYHTTKPKNGIARKKKFLRDCDVWKPAEVVTFLENTPHEFCTRSWIYDTANGKQTQKTRSDFADPKKKKTFGFSPNGVFKGTIGKLLYHQLINDYNLIFLVEGEKKADAVNNAIIAEGIPDAFATTSHSGSSASADGTDFAELESKVVIMLLDCDDQGEKWAKNVASSILNPKAIAHCRFDEWKTKDTYDVEDYLNSGHKLRDLKKYTKPWKTKKAGREIDEDKVIQKNADGLKKALDALNVEVRDCILTKSYHMRIGDGRWEKFSDKNVSFVLDRISNEFFVKNEGDARHRRANFYDVEFKRAINAHLYNKEINSFAEDYLKKLPKWNSETMKSSERLFIEALGADDTELNRAIGRMIPQAIVERAYCTKLQGVKFDYLPILIGTLEGEGKSSFCEKLLPYPMLYLNTFDISADTQKQQESIMGKVVVEMAELVGSSKPEVEKKLKNLMSISTEPQVRHAYKHFPIEHHRLCVFIATTNEETPIRLTGSRNRRMVPIRVANYGRMHVVDWLKKHRDEIFAHAIYCMKKKMPLWFEGEIEDAQTRAVYVATHQDTDTIDQIIEWYDDRVEKEFTMDELIAHLYRLDIINDKKEIASTRMSKQRYLGKLLQNNGFKKKRFTRKSDKKRRVYYFYVG